MIIQIVLVPALVAAVVLSLRSRSSLRGQARRKILSVLIVVFGVLAVIFPTMLQGLADLVGVTRGTDLLLYGLALVIIYLVGSTSVRFREQEARLTLLARQVALNEAVLRHSAARAAAAQPEPVVLHDDAGRALGAIGDGAPADPAQSSARTTRQ